MKNLFIIAASISFFLISCDGNPFVYNGESHGRGKADIYIEESFKPLFESMTYVFESQYQSADINPIYCSEQAAIDAFLAGKTKTLFITRDFTDEEKARLKRKQVEVRSSKIADDAVTLILNKENKDTLFTINDIKHILEGQDTLWKNSNEKKIIVFDQKNSANFIYLTKLINNKPIGKNVFSVNSNEEVINYVKNTRNAIGVIGVNWISDKDDSTVMNFLKEIKVAEIAKDNQSDFFKPYQAYIYTKEYPLTRELWAINKGSRSGLNSGFVNFVQGEKGQIIIQKSALMPSNSPVRMIQVRTE
jgi:phosphate transport system substrate-binding protein